MNIVTIIKVPKIKLQNEPVSITSVIDRNFEIVIIIMYNGNVGTSCYLYKYQRIHAWHFINKRKLPV